MIDNLIQQILSIFSWHGQTLSLGHVDMDPSDGGGVEGGWPRTRPYEENHVQALKQ